MSNDSNKKWIILCIIGGILMIIGSVTGSAAFFELIFGIAEEYVNDAVGQVLSIVLQIMWYIALGGGITVIIGALLVMFEKFFPGKLIITLGAGMGLIGLIIFLITGIIAGTVVSTFATQIVSFLSLNGGFGFIGVLIVVIARFRIKKPE